MLILPEVFTSSLDKVYPDKSSHYLPWETKLLSHSVISSSSQKTVCYCLCHFTLLRLRIRKSSFWFCWKTLAPSSDVIQLSQARQSLRSILASANVWNSFFWVGKKVNKYLIMIDQFSGPPQWPSWQTNMVSLFCLKQDNPWHLYNIQDYLEVIRIICSILHGSAPIITMSETAECLSIKIDLNLAL